MRDACRSSRSRRQPDLARWRSPRPTLSPDGSASRHRGETPSGTMGWWGARQDRHHSAWRPGPRGTGLPAVGGRREPVTTPKERGRIVHAPGCRRQSAGRPSNTVMAAVRRAKPVVVVHQLTAVGRVCFAGHVDLESTHSTIQGGTSAHVSGCSASTRPRRESRRSVEPSLPTGGSHHETASADNARRTDRPRGVRHVGSGPPRILRSAST
jgi:hypothetical protein